MKYKLWPYNSLRMAHSYLTQGVWPEDLWIRPAPPGSSRERIVIHRPEALMPGYRAIMGRDTNHAGRYSIWLLDDHGRQVHAWPIDYAALDPDPASNEGDMPHGLQVLEDGSVLITFDYGDVLARLDACGKPVWLRNGLFHHVIERADDGSFWTWRAADGTTAFAQFQYLVNFDADTGDIRTEYSLVDDILRPSSETMTIFGLPNDFVFVDSKIASEDRLDIFHPNDIEPLGSEIAARFPDFRPGDLLVSLKGSNLVAVLDPLTKTVKWWSYGPWQEQHDADFEPDGKIWVYNNNRRGKHSEVIAIDPRSRRVETGFSSSESKFYSASMGRHQLLPNGTRIIVSPDEGRVLETTRAGELVFEFNNVYNDNFNGHVENALWLPEDFFLSSFRSCPQ
ncbi:MAG TPA: arylsulfotransferase family protein [Geminicoccaceae bacterium]|nr:arylsulfotransferase family protein [Geminicoccaceae bacterium]